MKNEWPSNEWQQVMQVCKERFGEAPDTSALLFIIGLQLLGKAGTQYSKDEKVDIMHIAVCRLLEPYGYYRFVGHDEAMWPHWERVKKLPYLDEDEQEKLMKEAIVGYFKECGYL